MCQEMKVSGDVNTSIQGRETYTKNSKENLITAMTTEGRKEKQQKLEKINVKKRKHPLMDCTGKDVKHG